MGIKPILSDTLHYLSEEKNATAKEKPKICFN